MKQIIFPRHPSQLFKELMEEEGIKVFARSICQGLWRINQTQVHWGHCSAAAAARKQQPSVSAGKAAGMT